MKLTTEQEDAVQAKLSALGAIGTLLHELTEHWCVQVSLEMSFGTSFYEALEKVHTAQKQHAKLLIGEINQLKFPYVISNQLIKTIGIIAVSLLLGGIALRLSKHFQPLGLLLPGYIAMVFIFLPLWFLKKLNSTSDKIATTLTFLNLITLVHVIVMWMNGARAKWLAVISLFVLGSFGLWYYFRRKKVNMK
jgi:hypothetical protein